MLKKQYRISQNNHFLKVFKNSRPIFTKNLVLCVATQNPKPKTQKSGNETMEQWNNEAMNTRFGFVVSNKIDKRASRRNGLKRRLRAVIQELLPNVKPGFDIVIQVKTNFEYPYQYSEIKKQMEEGLRKINLISNS